MDWRPNTPPRYRNSNRHAHDPGHHHSPPIVSIKLKFTALSLPVRWFVLRSSERRPLCNSAPFPQANQGNVDPSSDLQPASCPAKIESIVRYLGTKVDDDLCTAEQVDPDQSGRSGSVSPECPWPNPAWAYCSSGEARGRPSKTCREAGSGGRHMVGYLSRKGTREALSRLDAC